MALKIQEFRDGQAEIYAALSALGVAVKKLGLESELIELVKVRASQINGCAFCLAFHLDVARRLEVPQEKLDMVAAWHEAPMFSERERAALAWTEAVTAVAVSDTLRGEVAQHFEDQEMTALTVAIGQINLWNRIAIGLGIMPEETGSGA